MKEWINKNTVEYIGKILKRIDNSYQEDKFVVQCLGGLDELELKDRVRHIITALHKFFPQDFIRSSNILRAIPAIWNPPDEKWAYFAAWPLIDYVGTHGIEYPDYALPVLKDLTPLFSAEFAIRPFIERHWEKTKIFLTELLSSYNEHHRRLVSEGTRPRLPWGNVLKTFVQDPSPMVPFLQALIDDDSLYVRKSVANHLNDISKDNPDIAVSIGREWLETSTKNDHRKWIVNKGLRSLIKAGYTEAFNVLGYTDASLITVEKVQIPESIPNGGSAVFKGVIKNNSPETTYFVLDYCIHYKKANGSNSPKVFKIKDVILPAGESYRFCVTKHFNDMTTRRHYPGEHFFELQINGKSMGPHLFILQNPSCPGT